MKRLKLISKICLTQVIVHLEVETFLCWVYRDDCVDWTFVVVLVSHGETIG